MAWDVHVQTHRPHDHGQLFFLAALTVMDATGRKAMPFEGEYVSVPLRLCTVYIYRRDLVQKSVRAEQKIESSTERTEPFQKNLIKARRLAAGHQPGAAHPCSSQPSCHPEQESSTSSQGQLLRPFLSRH